MDPQYIMKMELLPHGDDFFYNFPPNLRNNFEELIFNGKIGIGLHSFSLRDITITKQYTEDDKMYGYYYTFKIPYAGKRLSWEVIFNPDDIDFAPDFNFNDDTFYLSYDLDVVVASVPTLVNWNINNRSALKTVLKEFLVLHNRQQVEKLNRENIYSSLSTEFQSLLKDKNISETDVEVFLDNNNAHFLIKMPVNPTALPEYIQPLDDQCDIFLNPGNDTCFLTVTFLKLDGSKVQTSLQLSGRLDQVLGGQQSIDLPLYTKQTSLHEYYILIKNILQERVKTVRRHYKLKTQFMSSLCTAYSKCLIEFDSESMNKAVLLCEVDDYSCLVHIDIDPQFPRVKPIITLHSLFCKYPKKTCFLVLNDYKYSPRWPTEEIIQNVMRFLAEAIPEFKNHKH